MTKAATKPEKCSGGERIRNAPQQAATVPVKERKRILRAADFMELEKQLTLSTTKPAEDPLRTEKSAAKNINPTDLAAHKKAKHQPRNIDGKQDGDGAHG